MCGSGGHRCACSAPGSALNPGWHSFAAWHSTGLIYEYAAAPTAAAAARVAPPAKGQTETDRDRQTGRDGERLFFSYGFYVNSSGGFAAEPTLELLVPGAENVIAPLSLCVRARACVYL